ncbi:4Fe-4S ferredoxin [Desulfovibrio ferrophilus]|uniref:4Fe-4S ferredoxin n=2 Tax=Desulfovibrio ferrophilus TaxID=241368 RepID=A0A2Z6AZU4_9BACT|nr:4Fe-4S ferredoxin [Desulfovibrio ferrophilus]
MQKVHAVWDESKTLSCAGESGMKDFRYLDGVATLKYDAEACVGCGSCTTVCPHGVFELQGKKAVIVDGDGCMECGACAMNCAPGAITVTPGVGCAAYIIQTWLPWTKNAGGCC